MLLILTLIGMIVSQSTTPSVPTPVPNGVPNGPNADPNADPCPPEYSLCKSNSGDFESLTCLPLQVKNATSYAQCECYRYVHLGLCYLQCPADTSVQSEYTNTVVPEINAACNYLGLNPKALPQPPPWQVYFPSTSSPSSPTGSPTSTKSVNQKSDASRYSAGLSLLAISLVMFTF